MGFVPAAFPPDRVFIKSVDPSSWAAEQGVKVDDELLEIESIPVSQLSEKVFKAYLRDTRPVQLTFNGSGGGGPGGGGGGLAKGVAVKVGGLPVLEGILPPAPVSEEGLAAISQKVRELREQALGAKQQYQAVATGTSAGALSKRLLELETAWGEFHYEHKQPFGAGDGAKANVAASAASLAMKRDGLDEEVDAVLADLWDGINNGASVPAWQEEPPVRTPRKQVAPSHGATPSSPSRSYDVAPTARAASVGAVGRQPMAAPPRTEFERGLLQSMRNPALGLRGPAAGGYFVSPVQGATHGHAPGFDLHAQVAPLEWEGSWVPSSSSARPAAPTPAAASRAAWQDTPSQRELDSFYADLDQLEGWVQQRGHAEDPRGRWMDAPVPQRPGKMDLGLQDDWNFYTRNGVTMV